MAPSMLEHDHQGPRRKIYEINISLYNSGRKWLRGHAASTALAGAKSRRTRTRRSIATPTTQDHGLLFRLLYASRDPVRSNRSGSALPVRDAPLCVGSFPLALKAPAKPHFDASYRIVESEAFARGIAGQRREAPRIACMNRDAGMLGERHRSVSYTMDFCKANGHTHPQTEKAHVQGLMIGYSGLPARHSAVRPRW